MKLKISHSIKNCVTMLLYLLLLTFCQLSQGGRTYFGYRVIQTQTLDKTTSRMVKDILEHPEIGPDLDVWKYPTPGRQADIMSPPNALEKLTSAFSKQGINFTVIPEDVGQVIEDSRKASISIERGRKRGRSMHTYLPPIKSMDWHSYHDLDTINDFLNTLAREHEWVQVKNIGRSYEGRNMNVMAVTKAGPRKPNIWIEAGVHAREWIAPSVATFIARELVQNYRGNEKYVDEFNWYILPVANPDGYHYSRIVSGERLWRITRSDGGCRYKKGVDMNRNFGYHWGEGCYANSQYCSTDECSDQYIGPSAFSEIESRNIREFLRGLDQTPILGSCLHSPGRHILLPYSYATDAYANNYGEIEEMALDAAGVLRGVHGTHFDVLQSAAGLYPSAGDSCDWYKGALNMRFVLFFELREGPVTNPFHLPEDEIIPSGEEMWAAYRAMADRIMEYGY